jgi:hypothetical protein
VQLSARIARLLDRSTVLVAELEGALLGFCCYEPGILHFVYVEMKFRRKGVAHALLVRAEMGDATQYTHWTPLVRQLPVPESWSWDETSLERR